MFQAENDCVADREVCPRMSHIYMQHPNFGDYNKSDKIYVYVIFYI